MSETIEIWAGLMGEWIAGLPRGSETVVLLSDAGWNAEEIRAGEITPCRMPIPGVSRLETVIG